MTIETITILLYIWLSISAIFPAFAIWILLKNHRLKKDLAKQNLANRHYEEMLYASKDGYLTLSTYKNKEYQYCSRRLATLLNLKNGENSTIQEILSVFKRDDAEKINASFQALQKASISFEVIARTKAATVANSCGHQRETETARFITERLLVA